MKKTICLLCYLLIGSFILESCSSSRVKSEQNTTTELIEQATQAVEQADEEPISDQMEKKEAKPGKSDKNKDSKETWKRSKVQPNSSKLSVGENDFLPLKGTQVAVQIDGFRARVLIDYYYFNDRDRQLEGTFKLRLPTGASPYFLAFGETVVLDKEKVSFQDFKIILY